MKAFPRLLFNFYIFLVFIDIFEFAKLPNTFIICNRTDINFNKCLQKSTQKVFNILQKPIPEFGIQGSEVLDLGNVTTPPNSGGSFRLNQEFYNIKMYKFLDSKVTNITFMISKNRFEICVNFYCPQFKFDTLFHVDGQIYIIPFDYTALAECYADRGNYTYIQSGNIIKKEGKHFLEPTDSKISGELSLFRLYVKEINNGTSFIGQVFSKLINDNWEVMFKELSPPYYQVLARYFQDISQKLFNQIPLEDLFSK